MENKLLPCKLLVHQLLNLDVDFNVWPATSIHSVSLLSLAWTGMGVMRCWAHGWHCKSLHQQMSSLHPICKFGFSYCLVSLLPLTMTVATCVSSGINVSCAGHSCAVAQLQHKNQSH